MTREVRLPELGENVDEAEVLAVLVAAGDRIEKDQGVLEVETDKASVEVPAPAAGQIKTIRVKPGDRVRVGQVILELEEPGGVAVVAPSAPVSEAAGTREAAAPDVTPLPDARAEDLVAAPSSLTPAALAPAGPSVRRLARELGIDIDEVAGSGPGGRISVEDLKRHARGIITQKLAQPRSAPSGPTSFLALPDFSRYGAVERQPMSGVRRRTAETMTRSWVTIPHVTQFDRADITELEAVRKRFTARADVKLTLTAIVIKIVAAAARAFPKFNASLDVENEEIVYKQYVNIGVAVDTERGLLVPVVRDADRKGLLDVSRELTDLSARARAHKARPEELQGANLTVTNLGGLGTTFFSPLINWPEVAVVGVGRSSIEAVHQQGAFVPRLILPLSVSYDHRLIDGADAARCLRWVAEALENPLGLVLEA
jgi:pyruvate dehydrogenase E2 component (dihydrolipoamide acetyltransferase)